MPQLPFVVAPKRRTRTISADVNGETCSLEFPVFGSLLAGEEIDIRDSDYQAAVYRESSYLADALVSEGTDETEAQRLAIRCLSTRLGIPVPLDAAEQRILLRHADLVARIQAVLAVEFAQQLRRTVTAAIVHRLPGCRDWTAADTDTLPQPLQQAIAVFIDSERNGNQQRSPEELIEGMVETLGKLAPEPSHSPLTGPESIGDAVNSGPTLPSSAASDSDGSPLPTSSTPSSEASGVS